MARVLGCPARRYPNGRAGSDSAIGFALAPLHHRCQGLAGAQPPLPHLEQPIFEASSCFCARMGADEPEGGFPAGDGLGANSSGETVDGEPHGTSPSTGVLSPWAGHPAHSVVASRGPRQPHHLSQQALKGLRSSPVANH